MLLLLVGLGSEPVSALPGLTALLATPTQQPELLVLALPVPGAPCVLAGELTLARRGAL